MDPLWHTHIVPLHLGCRGGVSPLSPLSKAGEGTWLKEINGVVFTALSCTSSRRSVQTEQNITEQMMFSCCYTNTAAASNHGSGGDAAQEQDVLLKAGAVSSGTALCPQGSLLPPPHCSSSSEAALQHCRFGFFLYAAWLLDAPGLQSCIPVCCHNLGWIFLPMEGLAERLQQGSEQPSPLVRVCSMHLQPREQHPHPSSWRHAM